MPELDRRTLPELARATAPVGANVRELEDGRVYIEAQGIGGIVTAELCPDERTMRHSWAHLADTASRRIA